MLPHFVCCLRCQIRHITAIIDNFCNIHIIFWANNSSPFHLLIEVLVWFCASTYLQLNPWQGSWFHVLQWLAQFPRQYYLLRGPMSQLETMNKRKCIMYLLLLFFSNPSFHGKHKRKLTKLKWNQYLKCTSYAVQRERYLFRTKSLSISQGEGTSNNPVLT